jgi:uncharacterized DUF497 family protein
MLEFADLDGFDWDGSNRDKNWIAHQVSAGECEEVFFNLPLLIKSDPIHSKTETRYYVLGQTNINRRLFIAFTVRNKKIRVLSARDMSR